MFLSDGGEDIRQIRGYLHPNSEHVIDWFHITMGLTVLRQQTKTLQQVVPALRQVHHLQHHRIDDVAGRSQLFGELRTCRSPIDVNLAPGWVNFPTAARGEAIHWSIVGQATAPDSEIMS